MAKQPNAGREMPTGRTEHGRAEGGSTEYQRHVEGAGDGMQRAGEAVSGAGENIAEEAKGAARAARDTAADQIEQQKSAATESLNAFAQAIRSASEELSKRDQTAAARLVREAAGGLESLSRSLANRSLDDMVGGLRDFGRRNPAAFLGGAVLAGLALGRFARSSSERSGRRTATAAWESEERAGMGGMSQRTPPMSASTGTSRTSPAESTSPSSSSRRSGMGGGSTYSGGSHGPSV